MKPRRPSPARNFALNRSLVVGAAALATALALSGCQVMSPIQTNETYQPADGVAVDLGDVQVRDLVVITGARGEVGTLSGMVVNSGTKPVTVTFAAGGSGGAATMEIAAGKQDRLSGVDGIAPVTLPNVPAAPGDVVRLTVSTPAGGAPVVSVPVLRPDGYYATITPAPPQTSATSAS
ncbi:MAG: hypothetical protein M3537_04675 [Chloroflexota bacterium]|nr:hypothetical protein [Chloroflexota bacterium]